MERIPNGSDPVPIDDVYRLSPVLDRVLCVVGEWKPEFIMENLEHPIVLDLHQRLFGLIDIDDFLVRTIVCRILLFFARDSASPLLLPIARIFYKLSCDPANDLFFMDESLETVLMSLFQISQPEGRVFAAGAIRNVAACDGMREKFASFDFLALATQTMACEADSAVKLQLLGALRHLCKNQEFRQKLSAAEILVPLCGDPTLFPDVMRLVSALPEMSIGEKLAILTVVSAADHTDPQNRRTAIRALHVLTVGTEMDPVSSRLVLALLRESLAEPDFLAVLLPIAARLADTPACAAFFEGDSLLFDLVRSPDYDMAIRIAAYAVVKKFQNDAARAVIADCAFLDEIKVSFQGDQ
jgi:hypothetical protein